MQCKIFISVALTLTHSLPRCLHDAQVCAYEVWLYQKGADILVTLSWALSTSHLADHWTWSELQKQKDHEKNSILSVRKHLRKQV